MNREKISTGQGDRKDPPSVLSVPASVAAQNSGDVSLALGRIFRLMSRPTQPGDVADYERCRAIVMDAIEPVAPDYRPNWVRDRLLGAQGQS